MTSSPFTWRRHKAAWIGKKRRRMIMLAGPSTDNLGPQETTPENPDLEAACNSHGDILPPPYATTNHIWSPTRLPPSSTEEGVSLETLRARNPPARPPRDDSPILKPPPHKTTPYGAAKAAACKAVIGVTRALDEQDPRMVAARTAQAIAVAVSTSRSYGAFIAAVTAAESSALLTIEDSRDTASFDQLKIRCRYAIRTAASTALAADPGNWATGPWPFNIDNAHAPEQQQLPPLPELPPLPPLPPLPQEWDGTFWMDWAIITGQAFAIGYLVAWAFGEGLGRSLLAGTFWAVVFGAILILAFGARAHLYQHH